MATEITKGKIETNDILKDLRKVNKEQGRVSVKVYGKHGQYSVGTVIRRFGSWAKGVEAAKIPSAPMGRRQGSYNVTTATLLRDIDKVTESLGHAPSVRGYDGAGEYSFATVLRRFGSWEEAMKSHKVYKKVITSVKDKAVEGVLCQSAYGDLPRSARSLLNWDEALAHAGVLDVETFTDQLSEKADQGNHTPAEIANTLTSALTVVQSFRTQSINEHDADSLDGLEGTVRRIADEVGSGSIDPDLQRDLNALKNKEN